MRTVYALVHVYTGIQKKTKKTTRHAHTQDRERMATLVGTGEPQLVTTADQVSGAGLEGKGGGKG